MFLSKGFKKISPVISRKTNVTLKFISSFSSSLSSAVQYNNNNNNNNNSNPSALHDKFQEYIRYGDLSSAAECYHNIVSSSYSHSSTILSFQQTLLSLYEKQINNNFFLSLQKVYPRTNSGKSAIENLANNIYVSSLIDSGELVKADSFFDGIQHHEDDTIYLTIIDSLLKKKEFDKAMEYHKRLISQKDTKVSLPMMSKLTSLLTFLKKCLQGKHYEEFSQIYRVSKYLYPNNIELYNLSLQFLFKTGRDDQILSYYKANIGPSGSVNRQTFAILIENFCRVRNRQLVDTFIVEADKRNIEISIDTLKEVFQFYCSLKLKEQPRQVFIVISTFTLDQKDYSNYQWIYSRYLEYLMAFRQFEEAEKLFNDVKPIHLRSTEMYLALVKGYANDGNLTKSNYYYDLMSSADPNATLVRPPVRKGQEHVERQRERVRVLRQLRAEKEQEISELEEDGLTGDDDDDNDNEKPIPVLSEEELRRRKGKDLKKYRKPVLPQYPLVRLSNPELKRIKYLPQLVTQADKDKGRLKWDDRGESLVLRRSRGHRENKPWRRGPSRGV